MERGGVAPVRRVGASRWARDYGVVFLNYVIFCHKIRHLYCKYATMRAI